MEKKENQRVRLTKQLLKNALISLMDKKAFLKISIKEICEEAETNRSTFYLHYSDQQSLLDDIESELLNKTEFFLSSIHSDIDSLQYLIMFLTYIKENTVVVKTMLCRDDSLAFQRKFVSRFLLTFQKNLSFSCDEYKSQYIFQFLLMGCLSIITSWVNNGFNLPVEETADLIFSLCDSAVCPFLSA